MSCLQKPSLDFPEVTAVVFKHVYSSPIPSSLDMVMSSSYFDLENPRASGKRKR